MCCIPCCSCSPPCAALRLRNTPDTNDDDQRPHTAVSSMASHSKARRPTTLWPCATEGRAAALPLSCHDPNAPAPPTTCRKTNNDNNVSGDNGKIDDNNNAQPRLLRSRPSPCRGMCHCCALPSLVAHRMHPPQLPW